jgi:alpha-galactosidase
MGATSLAASAAIAQPAASPLTPTGRWEPRDFGDAPTPPMGWNSWNAFYTDIDEAKVIASAQALVDTGLRDAGYRYVNIDDGWWLKRRQPDGRMIIKTSRFASTATGGPDETSFRPFTDRIHAMGMKAGIYTDVGRNACSQVNPTTSNNLPQGNVLEREVGTFGHVKQDISLYFGDWGFDYVKVDACGLDNYEARQNPWVRNGTYREFANLIDSENLPGSNIPRVKQLYGAIRDEIVRIRPKNDFVLSLCNWGTANVRAWGRDYGNMWRTSFDIAPSWTRMLHTFDTTVTRELYAGPGHWNDPDMLFIGHGDFDAGHLTEARSHFALWAIVAAPLIIGFDLRNAPQSLIDIWGNREIVAVNQDKAGNQGVLAYQSDDIQIIARQLSAAGERAVVLFNRSPMPMTVTLSAAHLKFDASAPIALRDLWAHADIGELGEARDFKLAPRETMMLKATGKPVLSGGTYLSDMPARLYVAADGIVLPEGDPHIHNMAEGWYKTTAARESQKLYAGWGGPRADSTPYGLWQGIARIRYRVGIGALANSRLQVKADSQFATFSADVGIDDSSRGRTASVRFEVYRDGRLSAQSPWLKAGSKAWPLRAPIDGARTVELVARQSGTDVAPVVVSWANAALLTAAPQTR